MSENTLDTSSVLLTCPSGGELLFSLTALCDGEACSATTSLYDADTRKNAVRFALPQSSTSSGGCGGELQLVLRNLAISPACVFSVCKADLRPEKALREADLHPVNRINCLHVGDSHTLSRDEWSGIALRVQVQPQGNAAVEPDQDAVVEPQRKAVVEPQRDAAVESQQDAAVEPQRDAAVEPQLDAAVEPQRDATVEPQRDAAELLPGSVDPEATKYLQVPEPDRPRTKWLLRVVAAGFPGDSSSERPLQMRHSVWVSADLRGGGGVLCVRTPRQEPPVLLSVSRGETVESVRHRLTERLGVRRERQLLATSEGRLLDDEDVLVPADGGPSGDGDAALASRAPVLQLYFCDRRARLEGPLVWIFVRTPDCGTLAVSLEPMDRVRDVPRSLRSQYPQLARKLSAYDTPDYAVFLEDVLLPGEALLAECGVSGLSVLDLREHLPLKLYFRSGDASVSFRAHPTDTIRKVKTRIENSLMIKPLFHSALNDLFLPDGRSLRDGTTLESEKIDTDATLVVQEKGTIPIKVAVSAGNEARSFSINVDPDDRVCDFRLKVAFQCRRAGLEVNCFVVSSTAFVSNGAVLDEQATVQQLGLRRGSLVHFMGMYGAGLPMACNVLFVKPFVGNVIRVPIDRWHTVEDVKRAVFESEGIPPGQQRLVSAGQMLENGHRLSDYRVEAGDTVYLVRGGGGGDGVACTLPPDGEGVWAAPSVVAGRPQQAAGAPLPSSGVKTSPPVIAADGDAGEVVVAGRALPKPPSRYFEYHELRQFGEFELQFEFDVPIRDASSS